jgi:hypothetical protein
MIHQLTDEEFRIFETTGELPARLTEVHNG